MRYDRFRTGDRWLSDPYLFPIAGALKWNSLLYSNSSCDVWPTPLAAGHAGNGLILLSVVLRCLCPNIFTHRRSKKNISTFQYSITASIKWVCISGKDFLQVI